MSKGFLEAFPSPPTKRQPLEDYLENYELAYRIPILVQGGAIWLERRPRLAPERNPGFYVQPNDWLFRQEPLPPSVETKLSRISASQFRDYLWIAATVLRPYFERMLRDRAKSPDLDIVDIQTRAAVFTLEDFIASIVRPREGLRVVREPIRDFVLYSHGWASGWLEAEVRRGNDAADRVNIFYETLEALMANPDAARLAKVPSSVMEPRPLSPAGGPGKAPAFRIRGCRVGLAQPFLDLFKKVLGGGLVVTAPKFWWRVVQISTGRRGLLEHMNYSLFVLRPKPYGKKDHDIAVNEFYRHRSNRRIDGSPFRRQDFDTWIPRDPTRSRERPPLFENFELPTNPSFGLVVEYTAYGKKEISGQVTTTEDLSDETTLPEKLRSLLPAALPSFRDDHPFPVWKRWELDSLDEFLKTFTFSAQRNAPGSWTLVAQAFLYEVQRPVTAASGRRIFANFYPEEPNQPAIIGLDPDNSDLFGRA